MNSARDLTLRLADLLRREHAAQADFLLALAEFDRSRRWLELGHASLFYFLHRELGLSKGAAHYRKVAAGLVQRFPEVVEPLRDGRLCITGVVEFAKVLTPENRAEVLPRFFHRSRREAKEVSAELRPQAAPHREVVTVVQRPQPSAAPRPDASGRVVPAVQPVEPERVAARTDQIAAAVQPVELDFAVPLQAPVAAAAPPPPAPPRDQVDPLTADLRRLHVTVSGRFVDKLEAARAALSHSHPGADAAAILETGLDLLLDRYAKRRGLVEKPRREPPPSKTDHVPAHVKRAVWARDGGRCQWKLASGGICGSTHRVELDHIVPRALGGQSTVENTRLLCDVHNDLHARETYGDAWMDRFTNGRGRSAREAVEPWRVGGSGPPGAALPGP